jgi:phasin family protein
MDGSHGIIFDPKMTVQTLTKTTEKITSLGQENVEAMIQSGKIWAAGYQDIAMMIVSTAQAQIEQTISAWTALVSAKSLKEAMDFQSNLPHVSFEKTLAETGKITDASLKLTEETLAPIAARIADALEKLKSLSH